MSKWTSKFPNTPGVYWLRAKPGGGIVDGMAKPVILQHVLATAVLLIPGYKPQRLIDYFRDRDMSQYEWSDEAILEPSE